MRKSRRDDLRLRRGDLRRPRWAAPVILVKRARTGLPTLVQARPESWRQAADLACTDPVRPSDVHTYP